MRTARSGVCQSLLVSNLQLKSPRGSEQMGLVIVCHSTQLFPSIWLIIPGTVTGKEIALGKNINEGRVTGFRRNCMWQAGLLASPSAAARFSSLPGYVVLALLSTLPHLHPQSSSSRANSSASSGPVNLSTSALSLMEKWGANLARTGVTSLILAGLEHHFKPTGPLQLVSWEGNASQRRRLSFPVHFYRRDISDVEVVGKNANY